MVRRNIIERFYREKDKHGSPRAGVEIGREENCGGA